MLVIIAMQGLKIHFNTDVQLEVFASQEPINLNYVIKALINPMKLQLNVLIVLLDSNALLKA